MKIADAQKKYLTHLKNQGAPSGTLQKKTAHLRRLQEFLYNQHIEQLTDATAPTLEKYKQDLFHWDDPVTGRKLSHRTRLAHLADTHAFLTYSNHQGWIHTHPAARLLDTMPRRKPIKNVLTSEDIQKLLTFPNTRTPLGLRNRVLLELLHKIGLPVEDIITLRSTHIHLSQKTLTIPETPRRRGRTLSLPEGSWIFLKEYTENVRPLWASSDKTHPTKGNPKSLALFLNPPDGHALKKTHLQKLLRTWTDRIKPGIARPAWMIRRACVARWLQEGKSLPAIHTLLGYRRLRDTQSLVRPNPENTFFP
jgi:integrase/recombinase XerD